MALFGSLRRKLSGRVFCVVAMAAAVTAVFAVSAYMAKNFTLQADGKVYNLCTFSQTVGSALQESGITLGENDIISPSASTIMEEGMQVSVTRVFKGEITETEAVPFDKKFVPNPEMDRGHSKVTVEGVDGERRAVYSVTRVEGKETQRTLVSESISTQPVTEIIEYGTKSVQAVSRGTTPETAEALADCSYIDCKAYSYILPGRTATGVPVGRGVIAVDPKVIPLGTKVYVQSLDGGADYGYAVAADTGGAIKGNKIDMWVPTYSEAASNGVRQMRVYILPT